jgi:hypothetical protein
MHTDLAYAKPVRFFDKILDIPKYILGALLFYLLAFCFCMMILTDLLRSTKATSSRKRYFP